MNSIKMIGLLENISGHDICKRVYDPEGLSPTLPTGRSGNTTPKIIVGGQYKGIMVRNIKDGEVINMDQIRMFEAFAGIGAMSKALERKGVPVKLVGYSEIDKYASKSFAAVHGVDESLNFGDITKIDERDKRLKNLDLFTYGFPCQDISIAGKQNGMTLETRSGLLFEALRIIQHNMPKVCIAENVKNLVSKKFKAGFESLLAELEFYGYNNYWAVLNGLKFGVPQQRERVVIVSIRKDVEDGTFQFGESLNRDVKLIDMLEPEVDEKYYLSDAMVECLVRHKERHEAQGHGFGFELKTKEDEHIKTLKANYYKMPGESDYIVEQIPISMCGSGINGERDVAHTILAKGQSSGMGKHVPITGIVEGSRIRRLTPRECWRLMGFNDEDFDKARAAGLSDTQLYKQAGNSIIVDVLEHGVFKYLYKEDRL